MDPSSGRPLIAPPLGTFRQRVAVALAGAASLLVSFGAWGSPPPGFSDVIQVRFQEGTDVDPPTDALPPSLAAEVSSMRLLFTLPPGQLDALRAAGEDLPDLKLWFEIVLLSAADPGAFVDALLLLPSVDVAQFKPFPIEQPAVTPNFTGNQGYLGPATNGIDATFSATLPGGNGAGITIYDVEYSWNQSHEDLTRANGVALLLDSGDTAVDPFASNDHGTAVLGEIIADNDTKGVTGISWGANVGLAPANTMNLGYNVANAILLAVADASPGDVILIEQQTPVCNLCGEANCTDLIDNDGDGSTDEGLFGPSEWMQAVFDAIQTAVANRIVVVEAAGNGGVNLDQAACGNTFNRAARDSGAIIVGAGGPPGTTDRQRLAFSSFGSRVDLQGWGGSVMTTGYGTFYVDPDDPTNRNRFYGSTFNGTSSASPIVAGAAANLQGIAINTFGTPLIPFQVRSLLQTTGSPQLGNVAQNIGPRPDLQAAIAAITAGAIDLFLLVDLSSSFSDDLPLFKAQAPGIINAIQTMNPNVRFGLAKFEDYPIPPFGSAAAGDKAYERLVDLTFDTASVLVTIAGLTTRSGGDPPQSQLPALFQAASGAGQDLSGPGFPGASIPAGQQANFRNGATKLFLLWTDAAFHLSGDPGDMPYPGPTFAQTVAAINALDPPKVIGISSGPDGVADLRAIALATNALAPEGGVDCDADGTPDIPEGGPLVCEVASSGEGIGDAIVQVVEAVVAAATPVAVCRDVDTTTDPGVCGAVVNVDGGSFDPDGGPVSLQQTPPGPYPVGQSAVTLKVVDEVGLTDFCVATVSVTDDENPMPLCNSPATISPPDAPISFSATAKDNCAVSAVKITGFHCSKLTRKGKRVDKTSSCVVAVADNTITILDSGGVGDRISWTVVATDENGNVAGTECGLTVANPGPS
jgi:hypothetical protein